MSGRFVKGQSGNPAGRPRMRRPNVSAFDIIFDKKLTVTHGGVERELGVDEVLELQTYQAALKGSRLAIRQVLKMIEKREAALAKLSPPPQRPMSWQVEYDSDNANEAMILLGIAEYGEPTPGGGPATRSLRFATWATQAGISRPGRRKLAERDIDEIRRLTLQPDKLKWPRSIRA